MLAGVPLAFPLDLDPCAVDQQMQGTPRAPMRDVDCQGLLTAAERAEIRNRPVQSDELQQALNEPGCLPQRHAEQHLHRQAGLDGRIAVLGLPATSASWRGLPGHGGIEPDRQRTAALERFIVGRPVPGLVGGGFGSAHTAQLPHWIHELNPSWDLCNRATEVLTLTLGPPRFKSQMSLT